MRSALAISLLLFLHANILPAPAVAQGTSPAPSAPAGQVSSRVAGSNVLQTGVSLVSLSITVTDHAGRPVPGLHAQDFRISEDKTPQSARSFEEIRASSRAEAPRLPPLPPGIFTDYEPTPKGPLNVLLVDALNTPLNAQIYLKEQLREYIRHAPAGTRIAIFGLNSGLTMLQGFSSDPEILRRAIDHKLVGKRSDILNDQTGSRSAADQDSSGLGANGELGQQARSIAVVSALEAQFEAQQTSYQTQVRILDTIDAFEVLGHYLSSFPGRKNLVWFSGSFPLNILADPSLDSPFQITEANGQKFKEMNEALEQAQVAVYPVDARALETEPTFDAARTGSNYVGVAGGMLSHDLATFQSSHADEHATMESLAHATGGKAYFNTNALAGAVQQAIEFGSNYYALTYAPSNRREDGSYRSIQVELQGAAAGQGYTLAYRRGYYAPNAATNRRGAGINSRSAVEAPGTTAVPGKAEDAPPNVPYEATAMGHGAPTPSELLFKVRVLPASTAPEPAVAAGDHVNAARAKGPFQRYAVDFVALPSQLLLPEQPNGHRTGHVEFVAYVFDKDGNLLVTDGQSLDLDLTPAEYTALLHEGLKLHLNVSAPANRESYLRLAVHDLDSRRMGVVEVDTAAVQNLTPAPGAATAPTVH